MATDEELRSSIAGLNEQAVLWDDMDQCIIGVSEVEGSYRAIYSADKVLHYLMERDGMSYDDAREWMDYNMSPGTPGGDYPLMMHTIGIDGQ